MLSVLSESRSCAQSCRT